LFDRIFVKIFNFLISFLKKAGTFEFEFWFLGDFFVFLVEIIFSAIQLFLVAIVFKVPNLKFHLRNFLNFFLFQHKSYFDQWKSRARGKELVFLLLFALQVLKKAFLTSLLIVCGHFCVLLHTLHCIFLSAHFSSAYLFLGT